MEASQAQDMERGFFGHILPRYTRRQHKATPTMSPAVSSSRRRRLLLWAGSAYPM
jgi:hypothetical protein